ncbi:MAG: hypothetical protein WCF65_07300, partial [Parachlamydiaceae bacterium]
DKERKKERIQKKEEFKQNYDASLKKLEEFSELYESSQPSAAEATKQLDELVSDIRSLDLGRDELNSLREKVQALRKVILEKVQAQEQARANHEHEKERLRRQRIQEVKQDVELLLKEGSSLEAETIESRRDAIVQTMEELTISKLEKQEIERQLRPLRDLISEKKESSLLTLSDDDRQSLLQLKEILKQRKVRRQEIKTQIDQLRKAAGSSGFDFEQAMNFKAQVEVEKERLEKVNQGIVEIEQKIAKLAKR